MLASFAAKVRASEELYVLYRYLRTVPVRLRFGLRHVHKTTYVARPIRISPDLRAGAYCHIGRRAVIAPRVRLGNYVLIAPDLVITGGDHLYKTPGVPIIFGGRPPMPQTVIEDDVWIGQRVLITAGVRIGRGAIVAMGAVLTKAVEPYTIVGGVPARFIRRRFCTPAEEQLHDEFLKQPPRAGRFAGPQVTSPAEGLPSASA